MRDVQRSTLWSVAAAIVTLASTRPALAQKQCEPHWLPNEKVDWLDNDVWAMTLWDPDGPGPLQEMLVAGGAFSIAGTVAANHIAAWDGSSWSSLGSGINDSVNALTVSNGDLIAGGSFTVAGSVSASNIARWDGSSWSPLGGGLKPHFVAALANYNGQLIAGGWFSSAGGVSANNIARWDGLSWNPLGSGTDGPVYDFAVCNGDLFVGGLFSSAGGRSAGNIARWDGSSWHALSTGMGDGDMYYPLAFVATLTVLDGDLIAGGYFTTAGGVSANFIARWDGASWHPLGSGITDGSIHYPFAHVSRLIVHNGELIAGGDFWTAGIVSANSIARWDGSSWHPLGSGVHDGVYALTVYGDELIAGGGFTTAGDQPTGYWARWGSGAVSPPDLDCDGVVSGFDLALLLGAWGPCPRDTSCPADLDGNSAVNGLDLAVLLAAWG